MEFPATKTSAPAGYQAEVTTSFLRAPLFLLLVVAVLAGCKPPTVEEVSQQAAQNTASLLGDAWDSAADSTNGSSQLAGVVAALNLTLVDLGGDRFTLPTLPERRANQAAFDDSARFLRERLFTRANVESQGLDGVTFLVDGRRLCGTSDASSSWSCQRSVDDLQLRIVVSGDPNARLVFQLQVGPARINPATLVMENDRLLEVSVRLNEYKRIIDTMASANGAVLPWTNQLEKLDGEVRVRLEKLANRDFALSYDIVRDLHVELRTTDGQLRTGTIAAAVPTCRVHVNARTRTHELTVKLGATSWSGPASDLLGTTDFTPFTAASQGVQFELSTDAAPALAKGRLTVLPAHANYGVTEVANVSVAAPFAFTLDQGAGSRLELVASELDATSHLHLDAVPRFSGANWSGDETWHATLRGAHPTLRLAVANHALAIQVLQSRFSLEARTAQQRFSSGDGQCVTVRSGNSPVSSLDAVSCW